MDAASIFVVVMTAGAVGVLAYLELRSRRRKRSASRPPEPVRGESRDRQRR
jgi:hypothetical protein